MVKENRIVLSGYYGFDNIGDEAVLYCIIQSLRAYDKDVHITVLSNNPQKTVNQYQVESVNRWKIKEVWTAIKKSDLFISGGGSLLQDVTSNRVIPYYLGIVKMAQLLKKPVVFYSQGIGPVNHAFNQWLIKRVVKKVNCIFVRDPQSKQELEKMGVSSNVVEAVDPVLGLKPRKEIQQKIHQNIGENKKVGVYIRPWENTDEIINETSKVLEGVLEAGYEVYLIPMYYKEDCPVARRIHQNMRQRTHLVDHPISIEETIAYTSQFDFIIGMRLHSLIMATSVGVPMFALSYDPKVRDFCHLMGDIPYIETKTIQKDSFIQNVSLFMENLQEHKDRLQEAYEKQQEKIHLPAKYIHSLLRGEVK